MAKAWIVNVIILVLASVVVNAQNSASQLSGAQISTANSSDPHALSLVAQSVQALTGGVAVADVTLTGTATQTAGSWKSTGAATFKAKGYAESRIDFASSNRSEIRGLDSQGHPTGAWIGSPAKADNARHPIALHNTFNDTAWFFPALTSLRVASQPGVVAKYIGAETHNGVAVQHVRVWRTANPSLTAIASLMPRLSTIDFYLNSNTSLPVAAAFNAHSDKDMNTNIPIEVRYSDYRVVSGVQVPFHVQKYLNHNLVMDFQASQASIDSGLDDAQFE